MQGSFHRGMARSAKPPEPGSTPGGPVRTPPDNWIRSGVPGVAVAPVRSTAGTARRGVRAADGDVLIDAASAACRVF
jgi:hypothetical protein